MVSSRTGWSRGALRGPSGIGAAWLRPVRAPDPRDAGSLEQRSHAPKRSGWRGARTRTSCGSAASKLRPGVEQSSFFALKRAAGNDKPQTPGSGACSRRLHRLPRRRERRISGSRPPRPGPAGSRCSEQPLGVQSRSAPARGSAGSAAASTAAGAADSAARSGRRCGRSPPPPGFCGGSSR